MELNDDDMQTVSPPTPSELAKALFPSAVYGPSYALSDLQSANVINTRKSKQKALTMVMNVLTEYGLSPKAMTRDACNCLKVIREKLKPAKFATGVSDMRYGPTNTAPQGLYCSKCWFVDEADCSIYVCPIAEVSFSEVEDNDTGTRRGAVELTAVYPHNKNCTEKNPKLLNKTRIDPAVHGRGWEVFSFPSDLIFGNAFEPFVDHVTSLNPRKRYHYG